MKKILIISEAIAPFQSIASIRWTKIAKYLKKNHDVYISVITLDKHYKGLDSNLTETKVDGLLKKDLKYFDKYWMIPGGRVLGIFFKVKSFLYKEKTSTLQACRREKNIANSSLKEFIKREIREKLKGRNKALGIRDSLQTIIADHVFKYLKRATFEEYDVVISTYGPKWCSLVAEKLKEKYPHIQWLADFRDPCARDFDSKRRFEKNKKFVQEHCINADYLLRVSGKVLLYQLHDQKVVNISNGYDPDEALEALAPSKFYVVYTGMIYHSLDDLGELFHAFKELIDSKLIDSKDVVFQHAGYRGDLFFEFAHKWNLDYLVESFGLIERKKALSLQQNAAILLMAGWNTEITHCEWTGKMYEYMMAQKPIIYTMAGDVPYSLPSRDMVKLGGICYEQCRHEETYPLLKDYILKKYQEWKKTGNVTIECDENYKNQYAYPKIADQIWDLIQ